MRQLSGGLSACRTFGMAIAVGVCLGGSPANAAVIYAQNFEPGILGSEWSGAGTIQTTGGLIGFGFGALHLRNDGPTATILTLSGLAAHTEVTLGFSLAMWDSIDLGDTFQVSANGSFLYNSNDFGNYFPVDNISHGPGTHITEPFTAFAVPNYGINTGFRDAGRIVSFTFAHTGSALVLAWQFPTTQGGFDESFGVDNVQVSTNAVQPPPGVPEPVSVLLLGSGLAAFAAYRRRT